MPTFRIKLVDGAVREIDAPDAAAARKRFAEGEVARVKLVREDAANVAGGMLRREVRSAVAATWILGPGLMLLAGCKEHVAHVQRVCDSWLFGVILICIAVAGIGAVLWPRDTGPCPHQQADGEASALGRDDR